MKFYEVIHFVLKVSFKKRFFEIDLPMGKGQEVLLLLFLLLFIFIHISFKKLRKRYPIRSTSRILKKEKVNV